MAYTLGGKSAGRSAVEIFVTNVGVTGLNALAHLLLAYWLTPIIYGSLLFYLTLMNYLVMGAIYGFDQLVKHQIPRFSAAGKEKDIRALINDALFIVVLFSFVLTAGTLAFHYYIWPLPVVGAGAILPLFFIGVPVWAVLRTLSSIMISRGATISGVFPDHAFQALGLLIVCGICVLLSFEPGPGLLFGGLIGGGIAGVLSLILLLRNYYPDHVFAVAGFQSFRKWGRPAFPFFSFNILQMGAQRIDLLMLGAIAGPDKLALYFVALKIAQLLNFPAVASKAALAPRFSALFEKQNFSAMFKLLFGATVFLGVLGAFSAMVLYYIAPFAFDLLGKTYEANGQHLLFLLLLSEVLICFFTPIKMNVLMGSGQRFLSYIFAVGLVVSIWGNLYAIPLYGAEGTAWIRLVVMLLVHVGIAGLFFHFVLRQILRCCLVAKVDDDS